MLSRKKMKIAEMIIMLGAILFFIGFLADLLPLWFAGVAVITAGLLVYGRSCRCPKCGKMIRHLSSSMLDPGYCQSCGNKIEFDQ